MGLLQTQPLLALCPLRRKLEGIVIIYHRYVYKRHEEGEEQVGDSVLSGSRRDFLKQSSLLSAIALTPGTIVKAAENHWDEKFADVADKIPLTLEVNGVPV